MVEAVTRQKGRGQRHHYEWEECQHHVGGRAWEMKYTVGPSLENTICHMSVQIFCTLLCVLCVSFFFLRSYIYLFLAALGLRCGVRASHCGGFSCCGAQALGTWASVVVARGLSSCGSRALERRLSSCGAWA